MIILVYCYRFISNFLLLALVYFTLNLLERYEQRTLVAVLVIIYASMRIALALRSFHFRRCLERLEAEARLLATPVDSVPAKRCIRPANSKKVAPMPGAEWRLMKVCSSADPRQSFTTVLLSSSPTDEAVTLTITRNTGSVLSEAKSPELGARARIDFTARAYGPMSADDQGRDGPSA